MSCRKETLTIHSRPVLYFENGFRTVSAEKTLTEIEKMLLSTTFQMRTEVRWVADTPFLYHFFYIWGSHSNDKEELFLGKGLTYEQCLISSIMEFVERFCAGNFKDDQVQYKNYHQVESVACNPKDFILPEDSIYSCNLEIGWVWGNSLTHQKPVLIPANFVFLPKKIDEKEIMISEYHSNGLASGNCIEEAILHGLFELLERDALIIMEYNRMVMPDVVVNLPEDDPIQNLLKELENNHIWYRIKYISNDIPIPTFGVLLKGIYKKKSTYSYAVGTHISPRVALSRAITEAFQMYPRCRNYKRWLNSGPIDHLYENGSIKINLSDIQDQSKPDLKDNIDLCINILTNYGSEVIVVDLTLEEMLFPVVRVCSTRLQPILFPGIKRFSKRLFEVPVKLGYREKPINKIDIVLRELCGHTGNIRFK